MINDIAAELAKLHTLMGAEFSRQVERIALRPEFHPLGGETDIFVVGNGHDADLPNLRTNYNARLMAMDIKHFFEHSNTAIEVLIFKGNKEISVTRYMTENTLFYKTFRKIYEK